MHPSIEAACRLRAAEERARQMAEIAERLGRIETAMEAVLRAVADPRPAEKSPGPRAK